MRQIVNFIFISTMVVSCSSRAPITCTEIASESKEILADYLIDKSIDLKICELIYSERDQEKKEMVISLQNVPSQTIEEISNTCSSLAYILFRNELEEVDHDYVSILVEYRGEEQNLDVRYTIDNLHLVSSLVPRLNTFMFGVANANVDSLSLYYNPINESDSSIERLAELITSRGKEFGEIERYLLKGFGFIREKEESMLQLTGGIEYSNMTHVIDLVFNPVTGLIENYDL